MALDPDRVPVGVVQHLRPAIDDDHRGVAGHQKGMSSSNGVDTILLLSSLSSLSWGVFEGGEEGEGGVSRGSALFEEGSPWGS